MAQNWLTVGELTRHRATPQLDPASLPMKRLPPRRMKALPPRPPEVHWPVRSIFRQHRVEEWHNHVLPTRKKHQLSHAQQYLAVAPGLPRCS